MIIETNRLIFEEFNSDDLQNLHQLNSYPEVDEFNTLGIPKNIEETLNILNGFIVAQSVIPRSSYNWKILLKLSGDFIGSDGLNLSNNKFKIWENYIYSISHKT